MKYRWITRKAHRAGQDLLSKLNIVMLHIAVCWHLSCGQQLCYYLRVHVLMPGQCYLQHHAEQQEHTHSVQLCSVPNRCKDLAVHAHLLFAHIVYKLISGLQSSGKIQFGCSHIAVVRQIPMHPLSCLRQAMVLSTQGKAMADAGISHICKQERSCTSCKYQCRRGAWLDRIIKRQHTIAIPWVA